MSKDKIAEDRYTEDGVRMFNPTKPHGLIYADGFVEGKFTQQGVNYRADHLPVGYSPKASEEPSEAPKKPHWRTLKKAQESQNGLPGAS